VEVGHISERAREIKARAARFVEAELWPLELTVVDGGELDRTLVDVVRAKARAAGFSMLNMPFAVGGADLPMLDLVAIEEEAGKATNGLGFIVVDRGPRELLEAATPEQVERWIMPVVRGETREAWAVTEAGRRLRRCRDRGHRPPRRRRLAPGRREVVRHRGRPGELLHRPRQRRGCPDALPSRQGDTGLEVVREPRFMHDPYTSKHQELRLSRCRVPEANRVPGAGGAGARKWFSLERIMIAARCCGAAERLINLSRGWALERQAFGHAIADYQAIQFMLADSLTELAAARLLTLHAATAWDRGDDAKIVHGKVAMAKLYASEMANRVADRAVQIFGGRGYMTENPAERYFRELRVDRIWEGTSEIQRSIVARGLLKRGAAAYLDGAVGAPVGTP
jgi:alkylation response protein AidB-like acyl-CoA dehydrogenase